MYKGLKVSVVLPAYNEEDAVGSCIKSLNEAMFIDEIIAVDNNSKDSTAQEIQRTNAKYIFEPEQGYGAAITAGLRVATGDLIIMMEPDGTFSVDDILIFLAYSPRFSAVFGTRTSRDHIWDNAYMPRWVRFGNTLCAKMIELLFNAPSLSDVGCTFKLIDRPALDMIISELSVKGSHFSPHFMIRVIRKKVPCIEIPVQYKPRIGRSKITGGNVIATVRLGLVMFFYILKERFTYA
jgi:glycosyltransferase involved in cell wall biosynthesis